MAKIRRKPRGKAFAKGNKIGNRFPPGVSGNPDGRPRERYTKADVERVAQEIAPGALKRLENIVTTGKDAVAKLAADTVLAYAVGKPTQPTTLAVDAKVTADEQLAGGLARLAAAIGAGKASD